MPIFGQKSYILSKLHYLLGHKSQYIGFLTVLYLDFIRFLRDFQKVFVWGLSVFKNLGKVFVSILFVFP